MILRCIGYFCLGFASWGVSLWRMFALIDGRRWLVSFLVLVEELIGLCVVYVAIRSDDLVGLGCYALGGATSARITMEIKRG